MSDPSWNPFQGIAWENAVPKGTAKRIDVWKAKPSAPVHGVILDDEITALHIHWLGKRSGPCLSAAPTGCPFCKIEVPRRWEAYLGVRSIQSGKVYLAHLTKEAAKSCPYLSEPKVRLRGSKLWVERIGRNANSPCRARVDPPDKDTGMLPPAFNVREQLMLIWGGKGGLASMMGSCQTIDEARAMFTRDIGYDD